MKSAYLSACKWYSTNIISKAEFANVHVKFVKEGTSEFPTITIYLFAVLDGEPEAMANYCKCCKEFNGLFYINRTVECDKCEVNKFQNRLEEKSKIKSNWYKELLRRHGGINK
jgi:hypothetical protein